MDIQKILSQKIVNRSHYLDKIQGYIGSPLIKVLIGQRRVGKSTLLKSIIQNMYKKGEIGKENIFYINKELPVFDHIKDYEDIKQEFGKFLAKADDTKIFVGIDEVQEIARWEKFINGLLAEYGENIEIFITGSNAFLFSGELATYLSGRYVEFPIFPLDFEEFCIFKNEKKSKELFFEYLKYGGLPAIFQMKWQDDIIFSYLLGVYNTIVLKDIIHHHSIRNISFFKDLYKYTLSNIGNIISGSNIQKYLKSQQISVGNDTVLNFLGYAEETFLLYKVHSVHPETKKYFEIYNKYYVGDIGLRNALVGYDLKRDIGKLLENIVFLSLKKYGYTITIGRIEGGKEIDFIGEKDGIKKYFQVCYLLESEQTRNREYSVLEAVSDNWEKYVVSFDDIDFGQHNGIKHINIMDIETVL